ncbi:MAG: phosphoadenylyl-sulfate reductase [Polyangiaceae bacterium]
MLSTPKIDFENGRLELLSPEDRLAFAVDLFGDKLMFTSSFGAGSAVLLHLWSRVAKNLPVIFLDTGFLFAETLAYKDELAKRLGLNVKTVHPAVAREEFLALNGLDVMHENSDLCCAHNKVAPLAPVLKSADAWVSGLRRDQSESRKNTPILLPTARDEGQGSYLKVHPLATLTSADVAEYMQKFALPEHPLRAKRYLSIGCEPCTRPVEDGEDERAGRWAGSGKTECGLHSRTLNQAAK